MAVIAAFELYDLVAAREAASEPDGAHRRFGSRTDHADQLDGGNEFADALGYARLYFRRRSEGEPEWRALDYGSNHVGMRMPENHRAPRAHVIDVTLTVVSVDISAG